MYGSIRGVTKADARSLDYNTYGIMTVAFMMILQFRRGGPHILQLVVAKTARPSE